MEVVLEHTVDGRRTVVTAEVLLGKLMLLSVLVDKAGTNVADFWWTLGTDPFLEGFLRNISRVN